MKALGGKHYEKAPAVAGVWFLAGLRAGGCVLHFLGLRPGGAGVSAGGAGVHGGAGVVTEP